VARSRRTRRRTPSAIRVTTGTPRTTFVRRTRLRIRIRATDQGADVCPENAPHD